MPPERATSAPGLLERDAELAALDELVAGAADGRGRLVLIEGPAGIGKSGLLAGLRDRAGDDLRVLAARASELEREFAFGVVRQLLEADVAERHAVALAGAAAPAAAVFEAEPGADGESGASFAALHGLYWLALNLAAERPLLLAVDDLHWCDRPSLRFLAYLARRLDGAPVLVASTLRSNEPPTDPALLGEIAGDPATLSLRPGPLSATAVTDLVRERLGAGADPAFCGACHEATGGNPLLLRQLLRALEAEGVRPDADQSAVVRAIGPRAVSGTVLLRLARQSPDARGRGARRRRARRERRAARGRGAGGVRRARCRGRDGGADPRRDPPPRPAAGLRPPARPRRRLPRGAAGGARPRARARRARAPRHGRRDRADRGAAARRPAPRGGVGGGAAASAPATPRCARARPTAPSPTCAGRSRNRPPPGERTAVLLGLGTAEALTSGPAAAAHLQEAYDALDDPHARGELAALLGRALLFTGARLRGGGGRRRGPPRRSRLQTRDLAAGLGDVRAGDLLLRWWA